MMKRSRQSDGDRNSTEREESYFRSQRMKLEKKREYIKCVIMLLWAPCLLMPLLLVCNREEINFILWHFKSSLQVHRLKSYLIPRTGFRLSEQTNQVISKRATRLQCNKYVCAEDTRSKMSKAFPLSNAKPVYKRRLLEVLWILKNFSFKVSCDSV